jgi:antitoxin component of MazEF toxin-antitoxin module
MQVRKRMTKVGTSYAIIIDKPVLEQSKLKPSEDLILDVSSSSIIISPIDPKRDIPLSQASEEDILNELRMRFHTLKGH